jgi:hypothetical protein
VKTDRRGIRGVTVAGLALTLLVGFSRTSAAQIDMAGAWTAPITMDNQEDAMFGYYTGLPLNRGAQLRTYAYEEALLALPEWQCRPHGSAYVMRSPQGRGFTLNKLIEPGTNRFIGYQTSNGVTVYLDGRQPPSAYAPHTWFGFSTGAFEGNFLKFRTTHLKADTIRRVGVASSDDTVLTSYWIRHGDVLSWVTIHQDPVMLTEPMIRTMTYYFNPAANVAGPGAGGGPGCTVVEEVAREEGSIPHILPGENTFLGEYGQKYNLPMDITMGGAATMYPEAARKLIEAANRPSTPKK